MMGAGEQTKLQATTPRGRWASFTAAGKLLCLYFRHRDVVKPNPDSQPSLVVTPGEEGKEAMSKSAQEAKVASNLPEKNLSEESNRPQDGTHSSTPPQLSQASTSEDKGKMGVEESYQDTTHPSKKPEMDIKPEDTPRKKGRSWNVVRAVFRMLNPKSGADKGIEDFGGDKGKEEVGPGKHQEEIQMRTEREPQSKATRSRWGLLRAAARLLWLHLSARRLEMEKMEKMIIKMETRVEQILEQEGEEDMGSHFEKLPRLWKQCLLCFSIFDPQMEIKKKKTEEPAEKKKQGESMDSAQQTAIENQLVQTEIKKRTMIYWWIGERLATPEENKTAEEVGGDIFKKLVEKEFIEPIYNHCTEAIHECTIHPLILWMLKAKARDASFCDLDDRGKPIFPPSKSSRACLIKDGKQRLTSVTHSQEEGSNSASKMGSVKGGSVVDSDPAQQLTVVFNLSSHYYSLDLDADHISKKKESLDADQFTNFKRLMVLQLGRWHGYSRHHIEVDNYEFLSRSLLKRLRYLGLRGLSKFSNLPAEIKRLHNLIILDLRGCQNLERLPTEVTKLRMLTHLDLTECYMLEFIPKGLSYLSELQVFKGFVFGGSESKGRCKLGELSWLKKLRKLSINIASEARIDEGEMKSLAKFPALRSLSITWGQLPTFITIFCKTDKKYTDKKAAVLKKWTTLSLPSQLEKLDLQCFPQKRMPNWLSQAKKLKRIYIRGGKLRTLAPENGSHLISDSVKKLRLKCLAKFFMKWEDVKGMLPNLCRMGVVLWWGLYGTWHGDLPFPTQ